MAANYLPLTEYSSKHKVSISTLRRRIKADEIKYVFQDGKYLILDEPSGTSQTVHRPSQSSEQTMASAQGNSSPASQASPAALAPAKPAAPAPSFSSVSSSAAPSSKASPVRLTSDATMEWHPELRNLQAKEDHEPILSAANQLLSQLKRAYTQVLQEKEEQILHLKEEVSDLKTLVRVLEAENERSNKRK